MTLLDGVPGLIASALGSTLMKPATLKKYGAKTADGRGGFTAGAATDHSCLGLVTDYSDFSRVALAGAIQVRDRKAIVIASGLTVVPAIGDGFSLDGEWTVINVGRDPAAATYELQLRPALPA